MPVPDAVVRAVVKATAWLAGRGKTVSKHISHHTRSAANAAARNPRYLSRALGRTAHSVFSDPRPRKLVLRALKEYDTHAVQTGGRVVIEKQFGRAIGKKGETILRVVIDPRTGKIVTAFPVATFLSTATAFAAVPAAVLNSTFDERLAETIDGVDNLTKQWEAGRPKQSTGAAVATGVLDFLLDLTPLGAPTPAGDPDEDLQVRVSSYVASQADKTVREVEREVGHPLDGQARVRLRQEFYDAVAGVNLMSEDDD